MGPDWGSSSAGPGAGPGASPEEDMETLVTVERECECVRVSASGSGTPGSCPPGARSADSADPGRSWNGEAVVQSEIDLQSLEE